MLKSLTKKCSIRENGKVESPTIPIPVKLMDTIDLERQYLELRTLCDRLDPFSPLTQEMKELLRRCGIDCLKETDPFHLTNRLIHLLEETLLELEDRRSL